MADNKPVKLKISQDNKRFLMFLATFTIIIIIFYGIFKNAIVLILFSFVIVLIIDHFVPTTKPRDFLPDFFTPLVPSFILDPKCSALKVHDNMSLSGSKKWYRKHCKVNKKHKDHHETRILVDVLPLYLNTHLPWLFEDESEKHTDSAQGGAAQGGSAQGGSATGGEQFRNSQIEEISEDNTTIDYDNDISGFDSSWSNVSSVN